MPTSLTMANHFSLRTFQESLAQRLREASAGPAPTSRLGVQSGGDYWLLRLDEVGEILPLSDVAGRMAPVPLTKSWYLGVANVRGNLVGVVDLSLFTSGVPASRTAASRLVLVAGRLQAHCALLVDRMIGLRNLERLQAMDVENTSGGMPVSWQGAGLRDSNGQAWRELDVTALVADENFLHAGRDGATAGAAA